MRRTLLRIAEGLFVVGAVALFLFCVLVGPGCTPRVPSPKEPSRMVSPEQATLEAEAMAAAAEREKRKATNRFRVAVQRLEAETGIELAELTAAHDEAVEKADAEAAAIRQATAAAIKSAEDRQTAWVGGIGAVANVAQASGIPVVATIGGLLAGAAGLFSASANKRKARTEQERADAELAQRKATEEAAARVVDSIDILKLKAPEVAAAMKAHARDLIEWQGAAGMALVSRVQHA